MNKATLLTLPCLLAMLFAPALSRGGEFLLYTPQPAAKDLPPASPDQGVLVRSVTVKRGDTLADISRKYLGLAGWFPQLLVFNSIRNPDLIYPGEKVLVPVPPGKTGALKNRARGGVRHTARRGAPREKNALGTEQSRQRFAPVDEKGSYQQARRIYRNRDYQKSLKLFTRFIRKFPHSEFSADAALYRADCYLRLSGE